MTATVLVLIDENTGETIDTVAVDPAGVATFDTGRAAPVWQALAEAHRARGLDPVNLAGRLADEPWSDGALTLESAVDDGMPAVPNVLVDLREAMTEEAGGGPFLAYWTRGKGAKKIKWGAKGDFARCVRRLRKHVADPEGLCNVYHTAALGAPPGKGH